ncbi:hypothetical protein HUU05_19285 [candidate division KSB1 bacterium]|nr:hypothetical protein [candidate division KSB1 bacterium]
MARTKCYFHELQRPPELPYDRFQHHVCWICQSRLLELAKANYRFELREHVVSVALQPEAEAVVA